MGLGSGVAVSCGVGCRCGSDPELLWLWPRPVAAVMTGPLAWELPCALGAALKDKKTQKKKKRSVILKLCCSLGSSVFTVELPYDFLNIRSFSFWKQQTLPNPVGIFEASKWYVWFLKWIILKICTVFGITYCLLVSRIMLNWFAWLARAERLEHDA